MASIILRGTKSSALTLEEMDGNLQALNTEKVERNGSVPFTGKQTFVQPNSSRASLRLIEGSVDPSSPEIGDVWNNQGAIKFRIAEGVNAELLTNIGNKSFDGSIQVAGDVVIGGNLTVNGTQTIINSTILSVADKNIELARSGSPTDVAADGGGMTLRGNTDKTFNWFNATSSWTSSEHLNLVSGRTYRINNVSVLSQTALGAGVTNSSLQSVGTLTTGVWNASVIGVQYGGTGLSAVPSNGQIPVGNGSGFAMANISGTANQVTVANGAGTITLSTPQSIAPTSNVQFAGLGVGTAGATGEIRCTGDVTSNFTSDVRLKENLATIPNALDRLNQISGYEFDWKQEHIDARGGEDGYFVTRHDVGLMAQQIQPVFPELVVTRQDGTLAVKYHLMIPVMLEAIKELGARLDQTNMVYT